MLLVPNLLTKDLQLGQSWKKLQRFMQTEVEHKRVTNAVGAPLVRGEILYLTTGNRNALRAIGTSAAAADWVGVTVEPFAIAGRGILSYQGYRLVRFDTGLVLVSGTPAYVSAANAGNATNVPPAAPGNYVSKIGIIGDMSMYVNPTYPFAWVFIGKCCVPSLVAPL